MAKKGTKIALTYFITIIVTLFIIGGIGLLLLNEIMSPEKEDNGPSVELEQLVELEEYVPSVQNN